MNEAAWFAAGFVTFGIGFVVVDLVRNRVKGSQAKFLKINDKFVQYGYDLVNFSDKIRVLTERVDKLEDAQRKLAKQLEPSKTVNTASDKRVQL